MELKVVEAEKMLLPLQVLLLERSVVEATVIEPPDRTAICPPDKTDSAPDC